MYYPRAKCIYDVIDVFQNKPHDQNMDRTTTDIAGSSYLTYCKTLTRRGPPLRDKTVFSELIWFSQYSVYSGCTTCLLEVKTNDKS